MRQFPLDCLPTTGFVVDEIAMGFVYATDSNLALVDHVLTKPGAKAGAALLKLATAIHKEMKSRGNTYCIATTKYKTIGRLWKRFGGWDDAGWGLLEGHL